MDHEKQEKIALFRFGIIFSLLDERLKYGEKSRIIAEICNQTYDIPYSKRKTVCAGTIYNWLQRYNRKQRIEDLYPAVRKDKGQLRKLSSETELALRHYRDEHSEIKLTTLMGMAARDGIFLPSEDVSMPVIYRMFKDYDLKKKAKNTKDMRRFSMDQCNDCWMTDAMTGPKVKITVDGKSKVVSSKLWAYIDDKSRLITYAAFYPDETADSLIDCTIKAFSSRGLPRKIFTDHGPAMRNHRYKLGLAGMKVHLSFAKAYAAASKAKILFTYFHYFASFRKTIFTAA